MQELQEDVMPTLTKRQIGLLKLAIEERTGKLVIDMTDADVFAYIRERAEENPTNRVEVLTLQDVTDELLDVAYMIGESPQADFMLANYI